MLNYKQGKNSLLLSLIAILGILLFISQNLIAKTSLTFKDVGGGEHYKNILIGDRAATMGGAFTAISDDASGVFYNPAGLVYIPYSTFSGSANTLHQTNIIYKKAIGNNDWKRRSLTIKPNFFSLVKKQSDTMVWGLSYIVPRALSEDQHEAFLNFDNLGKDFYFNYHDEDTTTYIGPSISFKLKESLSVGASLYYFFRDRKYSANQLIASDNTVVEWVTQDRVISIKGIAPILGIMWAPIKRLSLGMSFQTHLTTESNSKMDRNSVVHDPSAASPLVTVYEPDLGYPIEYPQKVSVGIAYFASPKLLLAFDLDYYLIEDKNYKKVLNTSLGLEYFITNQQAFRIGYYTNKTNVPTPSSVTTGLRFVDMVGATIGYTLYEQTNYLTLGAVYSFGEGKAQVHSGDTDTVTYQKTDISLILSAGFGF